MNSSTEAAAAGGPVPFLTAYSEHGPIGRRLGSDWLLFEEDAIDWLAESIYVTSDRNPVEAGFCSYRDLPVHVKDRWIRKARDWLFTLLEKARLRNLET